MDDFFSWVFCALLTIAIVGCTSCSMMDEKPDSESVSDMASNCENGMKNGSTKERGDSKESNVECFPPPEVIRYVR